MGALSRHPALADVAAVLFDKDGTLLDFQATWGPATRDVLHALSDGDAIVFRDLSASCGFLPESGGFLPDSPIIGGYTDDFAPAWASRLGQSYDQAFKSQVDSMFRDASLRHLTGYDDVVPALEGLRASAIPIGLATNDAEATAHAHLKKLGIDGFFAFVAGYDSGYGAKPGGGMVEAFAEAIDLPASAIILVGDSPHDMDAARAAGAVPAGIARTEMAAQVLADRRPAITVTDLSGLLAALDLSSAVQVS